MTFDEILELPDKAIVPELRGRVVKVYEARRPTEKQDRAGIHSQDIVLQDDAGVNLKLQIIRKELHLPLSAETHIWHFRSVCTDERKGEKGLEMNVWQGDKESMVSVCVDREAHFYQVDEAPAERAKFLETLPHVGDLVAGYCDIFSMLEARLAGSPIWDAMLANPQALTSATSTIFIEGAKQNMFRTKTVASNLPAAQERPADAPLATAPPKETTKPAETNLPPANNEIDVAMLVSGGTAPDRIKAAVRGLPRLPDMTKVYDHLAEYLLGLGYTREEINAAHDKTESLIEEKLKRSPSDSELYTSIAFSFDRFKQLLPDIHAGSPSQPQTQPADDNSGLAPLD